MNFLLPVISLRMRFLILFYVLTTFLAFLFTFFFFYLPPYFCHSLCSITHVIKFLFYPYGGFILQTVSYMWAQLHNYILQYNCVHYKALNCIWNWRNNIHWILIVDNTTTQLHLTLYNKHTRKWNILYEISKRKAKWIGHILCRNCLLQQVIEGKIKGGIEVIGRWGRRRRQLLDDLKGRRGYSHLKQEALESNMWRAGFGRGFGPVVRQTAEWMNENVFKILELSTLTSEWREFPSAPCLARKKTWRQLAVSMLLKSRAFLTCFRICFLPGSAKDLSAPLYYNSDVLSYPIVRA